MILALHDKRTPGLYPKYGKFVSTAQGFATFSIAPDKTIIQFINYKDEFIDETIILKQ